MCFILSLILEEFSMLPWCPGKGWSLDKLKQTTLISEKLVCGVFENTMFYLESVKLIKNFLFFFFLSNTGSQPAQRHTRGHF